MNSSKLNILLIEIDTHLRLEYLDIMKVWGHTLYEVKKIDDAKKFLKKYSIDLILMNIDLHTKVDGIQLYKSFAIKPLLIYLTHIDDNTSIQRAIETQPLGYLIKPLRTQELKALLELAQLKINQKREEYNNISHISKNCSFDMKKETLYIDGSFIKLSKKRLQLLKLLIEAHGEVVSFKTIENEIYGECVPSESTIRTLIYRLRSILKEDIIKNELNFGIKIIVKDSSPDTCGT